MMTFKCTLAGVATLFGAITLLMAEPAAPGATTPDSYQVRNKQYGDLLRPRDANNADGTPIVLYPAQTWKCLTWKFHPAGEGEFQLQNHFTSKTFAAKDQGDQPAVTQVPFGKDSASRPTWKVTKLADGTYKITDAKSGKALTALKEAGGSSPRVILQAWQDTAGQKWELLKIDPKNLTM